VIAFRTAKRKHRLSWIVVAAAFWAGAATIASSVSAAQQKNSLALPTGLLERIMVVSPCQQVLEAVRLNSLADWIKVCSAALTRNGLSNDEAVRDCRAHLAACLHDPSHGQPAAPENAL
jgi:hypothetical protein